METTTTNAGRLTNIRTAIEGLGLTVETFTPDAAYPGCAPCAVLTFRSEDGELLMVEMNADGGELTVPELHDGRTRVDTVEDVLSALGGGPC